MEPSLQRIRDRADGLGLITTAQAHELGLGSAGLRRWISRGDLSPVWRGWYAVRRDDAVDTPEHRHLLRAIAAERSHRGTVVLSHHSEAIRLGLPVFRADLDTVHVSLRAAGWPRARPGLSVHPTPALTVAGRVAPALVIVQTGCTSGPMAALVAADAALSRGVVTREALGEALDACLRHPGVAGVRAHLATADPGAQSPGETRLRHLLQECGFEVEVQHVIRDGEFVAKADLRIAGSWVVVEFDGLVKYGRASHARLAGEGWRSGRDELVAEKRREDRIRSLGYEVVRVIWSELDDRRLVQRRCLEAITRSTRAGRPAPPAASPRRAG